MRYSILFIFLFLKLNGICLSQAVFEDGEGETTITFPTSLLGINTTKESLKLKLFYDPTGVDRDQFNEYERTCNDIDTLVDSLPKGLKFNNYYEGKENVDESKSYRKKNGDITMVNNVSVKRDSMYEIRKDTIKIIFIKITQYYYEYKEIFNSIYSGLEIESASNDGLSNLFGDGNLNLSMEANLYAGWYSLFFKSFKKVNHSYVPNFYGSGNRIIDWLTLRVGYSGRNIKMFDPNRVFADQIKTIKFRGYSASLYYNLNINGNYLLGLAFGIFQSNNFDALRSIEISEKTIYTDSANNSTRTTEKKINAKIGNYQEFTQYKLTWDFIKFYYVRKWETIFALNIFQKNVFTKHEKPVFELGFAGYLINPSNSKVSLGLFAENNDLLAVNNDDKRFLWNINVGVTLKWNFIESNLLENKN